MRKILDAPESYVDDAIAGVLAAHPDYLEAAEGDRRALLRRGGPRAAGVGLVSGGGFGHLPLFLGYVGDGLLTGVAVGNVFASPGAETMARVLRAADSGSGVVVIIGNYTGDVMNFELAAEMVGADGVEVDTVVVADDVASAPRERASDRRGIAGLAFAYKVAGALAQRGAERAEVVAGLRAALDGVRSMGVALGPCVIPAVGTASFDLDEGSMEIGMGIHGEPGVRRGALGSAAEIAEALVGPIVADFGDAVPERAALLVNGLGATSKEELYILLNHARAALERAGVEVRRCYVGEFATSMEMAGASLTLMRLDDGLERLLDAPSRSPMLAFW